jgi:cell division septation protein DedD
MEFKFSKDEVENVQTEPAAEKKKQSALLALLLLLVGGFSYVYFFTGIIKPQEASKPVEAPPAAKVVKMPLPTRDGDAGKADAKPADAKKETVSPPKEQPPKVVQAAPVAVVPPPAKTPPQTAAKVKEEPKKVEAPKPKAEPKTAEPAKTVDKKTSVAEKKPEPAKVDAKKVATVTAPVTKSPTAKAEKAPKDESGSTASGSAWTILVGTYVLEDALSTDMGRVRKAGLNPLVKPGPRKKSAMNRLFLSEFADRDAAKAALDKLKRQTSDAFILDHAGKYTVYAGSYLLDVRAASEMERLGAAGFHVSLKRTEIAIPSKSLTVGPYKNKKAADVALGKLKAAGVKAALSRQ